MTDEPTLIKQQGVIGSLLDKSIAIAIMAVVLYLGYSYHMHIMENVVALVKQQNEYLRKEIGEKLDKILERLDKK